MSPVGVEQESVGTRIVQEWIWTFADQVASDKDQLAARRGKHNAEILSELGFSAAEIAALEDVGALVQPTSPEVSEAIS